MIPLNLPLAEFKIIKRNGKTMIFDNIRKKFVALSPEEWVRQNFVAWLTGEKKYPAGLVAIEKEIRVNSLVKRFDIVVYNKFANPALLVECKAPDVKITQKVFEQAARYNLSLKVNFLAVTNGLEHFCCEINHDDGSYSFMKDFPQYEML